MNRPIFLLGFMGSGKTTWGKKLANHLNKEFIDLDHYIVERVGMSIPEYFQQHGEAAFRALESEVLKEMEGKSAIISTGGGSPCYFDNMTWIKDNGLSIYLYLTPKALFSRLEKSNIAKRPALKGLTGEHLLAFIEEKLTERSPYYDQAHIKVDQLNISLEGLSQLIAQHDKEV